MKKFILAVFAARIKRMLKLLLLDLRRVSVMGATSSLHLKAEIEELQGEVYIFNK